MEGISVVDRVLHVKHYSNKMPTEFDDLATLYEGYIPNRVGVNLPMSVLREKFKTHRFCKYDADYIIIYKNNNDSATIIHELLHAKFFMDERYRKMVYKKWESLSEKEREKTQKKLFYLGYPEHLHVDEWQAYGSYKYI